MWDKRYVFKESWYRGDLKKNPFGVQYGMRDGKSEFYENDLDGLASYIEISYRKRDFNNFENLDKQKVTILDDKIICVTSGLDKNELEQFVIKLSDKIKPVEAAGAIVIG